MKKRISSSLALVFTTFTLFSCKGNQEDSFKGEIIKSSPDLGVVTDSTFKTEYDVTSQGAVFDTTGLSVTYGGNQLTYCSDETKIVPGDYFITLSDSTPASSWLKKNSKMQTGKQKYSLNVYVAMITKDEKQLHVSKAINITLINKNVLNPVLYYVGGAVIIVAVAVLVYFARRSKERSGK